MRPIQLFFRNSVIFILAFTAIQCSNDKNCEKAMCTQIFAMVTVKLTDTTNSNLSGISTQTVLLSTAQTIHSQSEPDNFQVNTFTVADDSDLKEIGYNANQKVELRIFKNGNLIKTVPFTIKTDCCHVSKTEGPLEVLLN